MNTDSAVQPTVRNENRRACGTGVSTSLHVKRRDGKNKDKERGRLGENREGEENLGRYVSKWWGQERGAG